jgi:hypothetical protein
MHGKAIGSTVASSWLRWRGGFANHGQDEPTDGPRLLRAGLARRDPRIGISYIDDFIFLHRGARGSMEAMSCTFYFGDCPNIGPSLNSVQGLHGIARAILLSVAGTT